MVSSKGDAGHPAAVARDTLICKAVAFAGNAIPQNRNFLESLLEKALIAGVERLEPDARSEQTGRKREQIPNWDRKVGDFDIKVWLPGESLPSILIEAKVDDVGQSLWDLFKLTSVPEIKGAVAGYLLAAAESLKWQRGGECFALFDPRNRPKRWETERLFTEWSEEWADLTGSRGGSARLTSCPKFIRSTFIAAAPVDAFPKYEIRCVRVDPIGYSRIRFVDAVPQTEA